MTMLLIKIYKLSKVVYLLLTNEAQFPIDFTDAVHLIYDALKYLKLKLISGRLLVRSGEWLVGILIARSRTNE